MGDEKKKEIIKRLAEEMSKVNLTKAEWGEVAKKAIAIREKRKEAEKIKRAEKREEDVRKQAEIFLRYSLKGSLGEGLDELILSAVKETKVLEPRTIFSYTKIERTGEKTFSTARIQLTSELVNKHFSSLHLPKNSVDDFENSNEYDTENTQKSFADNMAEDAKRNLADTSENTSEVVAETKSGDAVAMYFLFATLGVESERYLKIWATKGVVEGAVMDAVLSARVEVAMDEIYQTAALSASMLDLTCGLRISAGYGDFDLSYQKQFFEVYELTRRFGAYLNDSMMMVPNKTVTAICPAFKKV